MRILIIEDNADIVANLHGFLEPLGYEIDSARTGAAGLALLLEGAPYDALVLDVMLPGMDGVEVCRKLRTFLGSTLPVLMLTARDTVPDKVAAFSSGTDDYMVKPFSLIELDVRLKALMRRAAPHRKGAVLQLGDLEFNTGTYEVRRSGKPVRLTPTGYRLLSILLRAAPQIVTRDELEREVWGDERTQSDALRTHIHALRAAIDKPFGNPMLRTIPGIGIRLVAPGAE
jgi:DNA-binding response OmpR family regulator